MKYMFTHIQWGDTGLSFANEENFSCSQDMLYDVIWCDINTDDNKNEYSIRISIMTFVSIYNDYVHPSLIWISKILKCIHYSVVILTLFEEWYPVFCIYVITYNKCSYKKIIFSWNKKNESVSPPNSRLKSINPVHDSIKNDLKYG